MNKKLFLGTAFFSVSCISFAQSLPEAAGKALGAAVGATAVDVGRGVNLGLGGNDAKNIDIKQNIVATDVKATAKDKSDSKIILGNVSGNSAKGNLKVEQKIKVQKVEADASLGSSAEVLIGNVGRK